MHQMREFRCKTESFPDRGEGNLRISSWTTTIIHQICVNRCETVTLPSAGTSGEASLWRIGSSAPIYKHRRSSWAIGEVGPKCDRLPSKSRRDLAADVPQRAREVPARRQRLTIDDLRRLAEACWDLDDPGGDGEGLGRPA